MTMKKILFFAAMVLFAVACNGRAKDKVEEVAENVAGKSVELYEQATPVVENAWDATVDKSVELYDKAAPVVEDAWNATVDKSVELYDKAAPAVEAEETVAGSAGNKVFFVMCNKSLSE